MNQNTNLFFSSKHKHVSNFKTYTVHPPYFIMPLSLNGRVAKGEQKFGEKTTEGSAKRG